MTQTTLSDTGALLYEDGRLTGREDARMKEIIQKRVNVGLLPRTTLQSNLNPQRRQ